MTLPYPCLTQSLPLVIFDFHIFIDTLFQVSEKTLSEKEHFAGSVEMASENNSTEGKATSETKSHSDETSPENKPPADEKTPEHKSSADERTHENKTPADETTHENKSPFSESITAKDEKQGMIVF